MTDPDRLRRFLQTKLRDAGQQYEEARAAFREAKVAAETDLPTQDGKVRIVCRRYAERRAVGLDGDSRPACFDEGHPDCEGCVEDIRAGCIETW